MRISDWSSDVCSSDLNGAEPAEMRPQARFFSSPPTPTTEAALLTRWDGQLYIVLGEQVDENRWQLRIWWKPFVTLIWGGGIMIALGGAKARVGRVRRSWTAAFRKDSARSTGFSGCHCAFLRFTSSR